MHAHTCLAHAFLHTENIQHGFYGFHLSHFNSFAIFHLILFCPHIVLSTSLLKNDNHDRSAVLPMVTILTFAIPLHIHGTHIDTYTHAIQPSACWFVVYDAELPTLPCRALCSQHPPLR